MRRPAYRMENCIDAAYGAVLSAQQLRNNKIERGFPVLTKPRPASDDHPGGVAPGGCGRSSGVVSEFAIATLRRAFPTLPASAAAGQPCSCTMRVHDRRLAHGHDVEERHGVRHPQCVVEVRPPNYVLPQCISLSGQWHPPWTYAIATIDTVTAWLTVGHCYPPGRRATPRDEGSLGIARPPWRDTIWAVHRLVSCV
jgi:hypothetical protein